MDYDFIAYIDESGDEGFNLVPPPKRISSEWFVISALICPAKADAAIAECVARYHETSGKARTFHFSSEKHEHRIGFICSALDCGAKFISVMAHKPSLAGYEGIQQGHYLFYYCAKLLLERITWFSDYKTPKGQIGKVRIIFSNRGQLKREALDTYLERLQLSSKYDKWIGIEVGNHDIKWDAIENELIEIEGHNSLPGLQVADAVASGVHWAVQFTPHFQTEHRYAKLLAPMVWRRYGRVKNYGLKFVPELPENEHGHTDRFHWLRHYHWPE